MLFQVDKTPYLAHWSSWRGRISRTPPRLRPWCALMAGIGTALLCAACSCVRQIYWARRTYAQPAGSRNGPQKLAAEAQNLAASRPGLQCTAAGAASGTSGRRSGMWRVLEASMTPNPRVLRRSRRCQRRTTGRIVHETSGGCGHASLRGAGLG